VNPSLKFVQQVKENARQYKHEEMYKGLYKVLHYVECNRLGEEERGESDSIMSRAAKDFVAVFYHELNGIISRLHVRHLALKAVVAHNGWCKDDSNVLGCHLF